VAFTPQTADADGDFAQVVLADGQHEILHTAGDAFMEQYYWIRHPDGPFTTLIAVATYLHPEADDLESLQELAKLDDRPQNIGLSRCKTRSITAGHGEGKRVPRRWMMAM
jgi:hypothetical protein